MRILIVGPVGERGKGYVQVGQREIHLFELIQSFDGPHDLFTCPDLAQAERYLIGLPFELVLAGGVLGATVIRWLDAHVASVPRIPRCVAYDNEAAVETLNVTVRTQAMTPDAIRDMVTRQRTQTGKRVDAPTLLGLQNLGTQARQVLQDAQNQLATLTAQKRHLGEAALRSLGFDPAASDYTINEQTGDVEELG